jgi:hypothetical protein
MLLAPRGLFCPGTPESKAADFKIVGFGLPGLVLNQGLSKARPPTSEPMRLAPRDLFCPGALQNKAADVKIDAFSPPGACFEQGPSRAWPRTSNSVLLATRDLCCTRGPPETTAHTSKFRIVSQLPCTMPKGPGRMHSDCNPRQAPQPHIGNVTGRSLRHGGGLHGLKTFCLLGTDRAARADCY